MTFDEQLRTAVGSLPAAHRDPGALFDRGVGRRRRRRALVGVVAVASLVAGAGVGIELLSFSEPSLQVTDDPPVAGAVSVPVITGAPVVVATDGSVTVTVSPGSDGFLCVDAARGAGAASRSDLVEGELCNAHVGPEAMGGELLGQWSTDSVGAESELPGVAYGLVALGTSIEATLEDGTVVDATTATSSELEGRGLAVAFYVFSSPTVERVATGPAGATETVRHVGGRR